MRWIGLAVRLAFWLAVLCTPLLGFWLASALAAYVNGPRWAVIGAGLMLFPVGPLGWELAAAALRRRRLARKRGGSFLDRAADEARTKRITTVFDRVVLRTLALNLPFLAGLGYFAPDLTLTAVATRGAWMLDDATAPWAVAARGWLERAGDAIQELNGAFGDNPYDALAESDTDRVPTADELGEEHGDALGEDPVPAPTPTPAPRNAALTVHVPQGATVQVRDRVLVADDVVSVPVGEDVELAVAFADKRQIRCPLGPTTTAREVAVDPVPGGWALDGVRCEEVAAAEGDWRPEIHMETRRLGPWVSDLIARLGVSADEAPAAVTKLGVLDPGEVVVRAANGDWLLLGPVVVPPAEVRAVHEVAPYVRLELTDAGRDALCTATTGAGGYRFAVVVDKVVRFAPLIAEAQCTGFVALETGDRAIQDEWTEGPEAPDADAAGIGWPLDPTPHPMAASLDRLPSIDALGKRIVDLAPDDVGRARLVHDWIALHVAYDVVSLEPGKRRPQDADSVYRSGLGVCAGYANLYVALAKAAGLDAVYVVGNVRADDGELAGTSHAWNAVKLDGRWALIDVTWDAGVVDTDGYHSSYRTAYLFTPPGVFRGDHLPDHDGWQLDPTPISRGAFIRQPNVTPAFYAAGLTLVGPDEPQVDALDAIEVRLGNPRQRSVIAALSSVGGGGADAERCTVQGGRDVVVRCRVPRGGRHELALFEAPKGQATHGFVGRILVNGL